MTIGPRASRPFRIAHGMILVAATAIAFAIFRYSQPANLNFTTLGGRWEQWLFYWMHRVVPFPASWSIALLVIDRYEQRSGRRRGARHAGIVACYAATIAVALTSVISMMFSLVHVLEDLQVVPKVLSHGRHALSPFDNAPMEEIVGAAVLGAWAALSAGRRWRTESSWIDRLGRVLGCCWIGLFVLYVYAYSG
jgi:hypothetical protein